MNQEEIATEIDQDEKWSELYKRFVKFALDNEWYDTYGSFYSPKQNLARVIVDPSYPFMRHRDELNFHPKSFSELEVLLTLRGY